MTKEEIYLMKHKKMKEMIMDFFVFQIALDRQRLELWQIYKEYKKRKEKRNV